jgi:hypothetical protein
MTQTVKSDAEMALRIPPPGGRENRRLQYLVKNGYLKLESTPIDLAEIPTPEFVRARRAVARSTTLSVLHADLKAVATWYLRQQGATDITYEQRYPAEFRVADVVSTSTGRYIEVGQVEDISRVYQSLGLDITLRGSSVSQVMNRYPPDGEVQPISELISIPFPTKDQTRRAWEFDVLSVFSFTLGACTPAANNRRNRFWP